MDLNSVLFVVNLKAHSVFLYQYLHVMPLIHVRAMPTCMAAVLSTRQCDSSDIQLCIKT